MGRLGALRAVFLGFQGRRYPNAVRPICQGVLKSGRFGRPIFPRDAGGPISSRDSRPQAHKGPAARRPACRTLARQGVDSRHFKRRDLSSSVETPRALKSFPPCSARHNPHQIAIGQAIPPPYTAWAPSTRAPLTLRLTGKFPCADFLLLICAADCERSPCGSFSVALWQSLRQNGKGVQGDCSPCAALRCEIPPAVALLRTSSILCRPR